ncbi:hypothetical protein WKW77_22930 [Variovorax ureilyticus]|uniref:Uncharacterized protein n=1 Tax=Variovorax ureilyticus TaxID=1836198 RepID=A0ABU8VJZ5_9BURK
MSLGIGFAGAGVHAALSGFNAIEVLATAGPLAGLIAVVHVRTRRQRRRMLMAEAASRATRTVFVDVPGTGVSGPDSVSFELTPQLLGWLSAAQSGALAGMDTPDAVMLAFDVGATWIGPDGDVQPHSQLVATRERFYVRWVETRCHSDEVSLQAMLDAHRSLPEGEPLYCAMDGQFRSAPQRRLRAPSMPVAPKTFYWVRAGGGEQ